MQSSHRSKPMSEPKVEDNVKKKKSHSSSISSSAAAAVEDKTKREKHKHHHHHHRSRSSESSSQQSYRVPPASDGARAVAASVDVPHRLSSPHQQVVAERDESDERIGRYGGAQLCEAAFTPQALTSTSRNRIAEDFLSMLCPQQYYGKVKKINRIRPFKANRSAATGLRSCNSIYVATKGTMPNPYFYPQLRLRDTDGEQPTGLSGDEAADGAVDTPIILYEAAPGTMLFAETELDARRLL